VPHVTDLMLLSRPLPGKPVRSENSHLEFETHSERTHPAFVRIVESTYEETLDCPALARIRSGELMLEAHRSTGRFRPEMCRIYRKSGADIGILLLAEHPDRNVWEVAYLGVVPAARGKGFGRMILGDGIQDVQSSGHPRMEIAVDVANEPALRIYRNFGFTDERRYAVHLRFRPQSETAEYVV